MKNHTELLKHRHFTKIGISDTGGLIIRFDDESHTYIPKDIFKDVWQSYAELMPFFDEEE